MEQFIKTVVNFCSGFACGCLYSSYKFDRNPNELIGMAKNDVAAGAANTAVAMHNAGEKISNKIKSFKKDGKEDE